MSNIPNDLKYVKSHEWIRDHGDGTVTIGITDHAQNALGDLVFVEAPEAGRNLTADEACSVVESVKAASDVYAPIAGTVLEANTALNDQPELVNQDPYGKGWLWKQTVSNAADLATLLDAAGYAAALKADGH